VRGSLATFSTAKTKILRWICVICLAAITTACEVSVDIDTSEFDHDLGSDNFPWTHDNFDDANDKFTFAIFSDLYGGERERIFNIAMAQLNLLRPELILSVGDLINGGTEDRAQLAKEWNEFDKEWNEFDAKVSVTRAPAFYVGGNHDLTNLTMREVWIERYAARYYHFVYKNVLFLMLDSEDFEEQRMQEIYKARAIALEIPPEAAPSPSRSHRRIGGRRSTTTCRSGVRERFARNRLRIFGRLSPTIRRCVGLSC
jgi:hypothetical protein